VGEILENSKLVDQSTQIIYQNTLIHFDDPFSSNDNSKHAYQEIGPNIKNSTKYNQLKTNLNTNSILLTLNTPNKKKMNETNL